jgi:hypothetical protein
LQSCLLEGDRVSSAWEQWLHEVEDPLDFIRRDRSGVNRLLPLLYAAVKDLRPGIDGMLRTCLRTAHVREQLRMKTYFEIFWPVVDALKAGRVDAIYLNGASLAKLVYAYPGLRHCHDIDIYISEDDTDRAVDVLRTAQFDCMEQTEEFARLEHGSKLPINLHSRLRYQRRVSDEFREIYAARAERTIDGRKLSVLPPTQMFLQLCSGLREHSRVGPIQLFCDAWYVKDRAENWDRTALEAQAVHYGVDSECRAVLEHLENELDASRMGTRGSARPDVESMPTS